MEQFRQEGCSTPSAARGVAGLDPAHWKAAAFYVHNNCKIGDRVTIHILIQDVAGEPGSPCS